MAFGNPGSPAAARDGSRLARLAAVAVPVLVAVGLSVFQVHNDDLGFHVASGRWVRATGAAPAHNPFSYAEDGATWVQHQWLSAAGISWVVDAWGVKAVILVKALLVGLSFAALGWWALRAGLPAGFAMALLAVAVAAAANRFYVRPYVLSMIALAVVTTTLLAWLRAGLRRSPLPWVAAAVTVVSVHLHAGGLYTLLVWGAVGAGALALRVPPFARGGATPPPPLGRLVVAGLATLAAVVGSLWALAPSGLALLGLPFSFATNAYWNAHLVEFRRLPFVAPLYLQWIAVGVTALGLVGAALRRRPVELLLLAGFGYLGLAHMRLVWPMAVVGTAAVTALVPGSRLAGPLGRRAGQGLAVAAAVALLALGGVAQAGRFRMGLGEDGIDRRHHPLEMLALARALPGETFVSDGLAGMWLWWNFRAEAPDGRPLAPPEQRRVLVHNCLECYREETFLDLYQAVRYGEPGWEDKVTALGIRSFLLKHTSPGERRFQGGKPNVRQHLFLHPDWRLVDFDDVASAYVLRAADPAGPDTGAPFPVDPDTGQVRPGATYPEVRAALLEHAERHPGVARSLALLAYVAHGVEDWPTMGVAVRGMLERQPDNPLGWEMLDVLKRSAGAAAGR